MASDADLEGRLSKVEESVRDLKLPMEGLKYALPIFMGAVGLALTALVFAVNATNSRIDRFETKIDAIPARLAEEFRAMRTEMAAQTSAIANSITAARQVQPQVLILPPERPLSGSPTEAPPLPRP